MQFNKFYFYKNVKTKYLTSMFKYEEMMLIRQCLLEKVDQNLKKLRKHNQESLQMVAIVKKINLLLDIPQI